MSNENEKSGSTVPNGEVVRQPISEEEQARRCKAIETARRSSQLSGFKLDETTEALNARYVAGELTRKDLTAAVLNHTGLPEATAPRRHGPYPMRNPPMPAIVENRRRSWISFSLGLSIVWILMAILAGIGLGRALDSLSPLDRKLHIACDRVVERLLNTHDPVELERSRILVNALHCGVSRRVGDWPAGRTGGLVP
jgi:hypothetical protein